MQISTTARHCELDPEVRLFVQNRLEKLERYASDIHEARVIVTAEKFRHVAEITLRLNHHELVSREESTEARIALDLAVDHLEHQLRRVKERRVDRSHRGRGESGAPPASDEPLDEEV